MSERDYQAKEEECLRRLSEPEGDHELHAALERMRVEYPTFVRCSTGCTSRMMPTPQSSRSGEGRLRVAKSRSGHPTTTRPRTSCRWRSSSFTESLANTVRQPILVRSSQGCWTGAMHCADFRERS